MPGQAWRVLVSFFLQRHIASGPSFSFMFLSFQAWAADTWYPANARLVQWNAVTQLSNGDPVPAGDIVEYEVLTVVEGQDKSTAVSIAVISETQYTIVFLQEGRYRIGITALRTPQGETESLASEISWSDDIDVCFNSETFGIKFYMLLQKVSGMR